ncbi:MAG TPA: M28 family peptidase [Bryobacteraceae bacterium]|nr:M28 family peptidase [Bryobacteraceae bacterium]
MPPMRCNAAPRIAAGALFLGLCSFGQNVAIHFDTLPANDINRRLDDFKNTNAARESELRALFAEAGCKGEQLTEQAVNHSHVPNLICTMPGKDDTEIIVGAHFDFVDKGQGVVDNWSGCSLLPSLYESLRTAARRHTFVFIGFTDEEKGMVGSQFFVHEISKENLRKISAMVNMDSLGAGPTEFELDRGDKRLADALARPGVSRCDPRRSRRGEIAYFFSAGVAVAGPIPTISSVTSSSFAPS